MVIKDYELAALFSEPYFRTNIGHAIGKEQIEYIKKLDMVQNKANLISENLYIFEEPELKSIKDAVQEILDFYASEVMGIRQKLYVTQSWSLTNNPNVSMHGHSHSNSIISGSLYYCDLPDPVARMVFDRHRTYQQIELNPELAKRTVYNAPINILTPKKHEIFLFPSGQQHFVETNESDQPRHAIAFNTFVKGKLGDYRDVSELML